MIGMIVVKKFSEMKKESEKLNYPKTLNFSYVDKDLELVTRDYIKGLILQNKSQLTICLLYTSPSPRDLSTSRMPSSA